MIRVLAVSGWGEVVEEMADEYGFWKIADELEEAGCEVIRRAWNEVTPEDLDNVDVRVTYSYGTAAVEEIEAACTQAPLPACGKWYILVGVPRAKWKQNYNLWNVQKNVEYAKSFNLDGFPVSEGLRNPDGITRVNVDCNGRGLNHVSIQDDATVRQTIVNEIKTMILTGM